MKEKEDTDQLELFSDTKDPALAKDKSHNASVLKRIWAYEKTILIIIGMVTTGIVSFSLGVERGKKIVPVQQKPRFDLSLPPAQKGEIAVKQTVERAQTKTEEPSLSGFTVQIASYKNKSAAQKQAEVLEKKGVSTLVLTKGQYTILCIGRFSDEKNAGSTIAELKKNYKDCFLRRL